MLVDLSCSKRDIKTKNLLTETSVDIIMESASTFSFLFQNFLHFLTFHVIFATFAHFLCNFKTRVFTLRFWNIFIMVAVQIPGKPPGAKVSHTI